MYAGLVNGSVLVYDLRNTSSHVQELAPQKARQGATHFFPVGNVLLLDHCINTLKSVSQLVRIPHRGQSLSPLIYSLFIISKILRFCVRDISHGRKPWFTDSLITQHGKMKSNLCSEPSSTMYEMCDLGPGFFLACCELHLSNMVSTDQHSHISNTQVKNSKGQPYKKIFKNFPNPQLNQFGLKILYYYDLSFIIQLQSWEVCEVSPSSEGEWPPALVWPFRMY